MGIHEPGPVLQECQRVALRQRADRDQRFIEDAETLTTGHQQMDLRARAKEPPRQARHFGEAALASVQHEQAVGIP